VHRIDTSACLEVTFRFVSGQKVDIDVLDAEEATLAFVSK